MLGAFSAIVLVIGTAGTLAGQVPVKSTNVTFRLGGGTASEEYAFPQAPSLVVDASERIYARIPSDGAVWVYSSDGFRLNVIGRRGNGPGEFTLATAHGVVGDTLWILNGPNPRLSKFTLQGEHLKTVRSGFDYGVRFPSIAGISALLSHGRVYTEPPNLPPMGVSERIELPVMLGSISTPASDTIAFVDVPRGLFLPRVGAWAFETTPRSPLVEPDPQGERVGILEWSDEVPGVFRMTVLAPDGKMVWSKRFLVPSERITRRERDSVVDAAFERARDAIAAATSRGIAVRSPRDAVARGLDLRVHHAPIRRILFGVDGTIWLQQLVRGRPASWAVLSESGKLEFQVVVPRNVRVEAASRTAVWGVELDSLDVPYLVRLSITG